MKPLDAPLVPPPGALVLPVRQLRGGERRDTHDWVAEEVPVALEYNGVSHAVMLATPADLEDFALGFSLTEGIVGSRADVRDIEVTAAEAGITVHVEIASACFAQLKDRRRNLAGRTGCGLCGTESLEQAVRPQPEVAPATFSAAAVRRALAALRDAQPLHSACGSVHATAFARPDGSLLCVREDVGRHNALDKLAGALAFAGIDGAGGFVVATSRASYEMVGKTCRIGAGLLAAVSGVTGLAVRVAQQSGLCLAGFARGDALNLYTFPGRIGADE